MTQLRRALMGSETDLASMESAWVLNRSSAYMYSRYLGFCGILTVGEGVPLPLLVRAGVAGRPSSPRSLSF